MLTAKVLLYVHQREIPAGFPIKIRFTDGRTKKSTYVKTAYYSRKKDFDTEPRRSHPQYEALIFDYFDWRKKIAALLPRAKREGWRVAYLAKQFRRDDYFDVQSFVASLKRAENTKETYKSALSWLGHADCTTLTGTYVSPRVVQWQRSNGLNVYLRSLRALWNKAAEQG